jgi:hypothetical protein
MDLISFMNRLEKLKKQNPKLDVSLIDIIAACEPTNTYKYMDLLLKVLKDEFILKNDYESFYKKIGLYLFGAENLIQLIEFENHIRNNRIEKTDIGLYRNFNDIMESVEKADHQVQIKQVEKDVVKLYDTEFWLILIPLTFEASKVYGYNTKWCSTQKVHWDRYYPTFKLIYVINKKENKKWAISIEKKTKEVLGWLSNDNKTNAYDLPFTNEMYDIIIREIKKFESTSDVNKQKHIPIKTNI